MIPLIPIFCNILGNFFPSLSPSQSKRFPTVRKQSSLLLSYFYNYLLPTCDEITSALKEQKLLCYKVVQLLTAVFHSQVLSASSYLPYLRISAIFAIFVISAIFAIFVISAIFAISAISAAHPWEIITLKSN